MKKNGREFILEFRTMSHANPKGKEFWEMIENNNIDNENIVIYSDTGNAIWAALYNPNDQSSIGMCTKISDCKDNTYTGDEIKDFIEIGDYNITFDKVVKKNVFSIKIIEEIEEIINKNITTTTLEEAIQKIISEKICTKKEVEERVKVMKANRVSEKIIIKTLLSYKKYDREIKKPSTIFVDPNPNSEESIMQSALISAGTKRPTIFNGLHSSGKNVCAETLAWLLNKPYFLVGISAHSDMEELFGAKSTEVPELNSLPEKELIKLAKASEDIKAYNIELSRHQTVMEMYENAGKINNEVYKNASNKASELEKKINKIKVDAAKYDVLKAKASSVAIKTELSEFVDWLQTGGVLMLNGATCLVMKSYYITY